MSVATTGNGSENGSEKTMTTLGKLNMHFGKMKQQMGLVLPRHMTPDRMARLALTAFNSNHDLQMCSFESIAASVLIASQMGLEIGVGGQGWLIPYNGKATFVPGWQGLLELLNRSGRATAWTGSVFQGDSFEWELGDSPFVKHKPIGGKVGKPLFTYAIGRVKGMDWPIIEVWTREAVEQHRTRYNKVGKKHYSFTNDNNWEMYSRKVPLLQVLKYLPKSIELQAAIDASYAADTGSNYTINADFTVTADEPADDSQGGTSNVADDAAKLAEQLKSKQASKQSSESTEGQSEERPKAPEGEPDIVGSFFNQIQECDDVESVDILEQSIKQSRSLNDDEKRSLLRNCKTRASKLGQ